MNIFFMNFKRNMKAAFITLKSNFKEYICFLIALVMVQMLFGVLSISFFNNRKVEKQIILDEGYDYHCEINDLDAADINILGSLYTKHTLQKDRTFEYRVNGNNYRIVFTDDYEINYQMFQNAVREMNEGYEHVSLQKTPLYDHEISAGGSFAALFPLLLVLMALSFFLITALFRTVDRRWARTNTVRPCISRSMPRCTSASVRVSMEDVASSSIITGGSATAARAMESSCRWPWLSPLPSPSSMVL